MIVIRHAHGYMTLYGHLSKVMVKSGQRVVAGQQIAVSGNTGHSTGPHLHFSVYHNCHVMDPYGWTGKGDDPLRSFNGETSNYLWKRNEAPDVLNFIPGWPSYGSGVLPKVDPAKPINHRIAHLLLLKVPNGKPTDPGVSLANFQQQLTNEQQQLTGLLTVLKSEGLISSFSPVTNAGAVRVVGSISDQQLNGLPGVASILGDRTRDQRRAESSLMQSLVSEMVAPPSTPLYSSSLLDDQWSWRISLSAQEGGPYVLGFTHPGSKVTIKVSHHGIVLASGIATSSSANGAFMVTVNRPNGQNYSITQGDVVSASSDGKSTSVYALPLSIDAKPATETITGIAPAGARLAVTAIEQMNGKVANRSVLASQKTTKDLPARYSLALHHGIVSGDSVIARVTEASGNTLFAWSKVPGLQVSEGSSTIHGWARATKNLQS